MSESGASPRARNKDWALTAEALDRLLALFDADRERAGEKYEQMRRKLVKFFEWRDCANPEEHVDRVFDRVARQAAAGLRIESLAAYFHGVAINVWRENQREAGRGMDVDVLANSARIAVDPAAVEQREAERLGEERRLACLERCIARLPVESRRLVVSYHQPETGRIGARKRLAGALGIPLNALRVRACRLRAGLESCVEECARWSSSV